MTVSSQGIGWSYRASRRGRCLALAAGLIGLVAPPSAEAHVHSGIVATEYRATIAPLEGTMRSALAMRIYDTDRAIQLTVDPGHRITVLAGSGEPLLRVDSDGLAVNEASRAVVGTGLLPKAGIAPGARAHWRRLSGDRSVVWHDTRLRGLPDTIDSARWRIPIILDGARLRLEGGIRRIPAPAAWWWLVCAGIFAVASALVLRLSRPAPARTAEGFGRLAAAATIAVILTFALSASAPMGSRFVAFDLLVFAGAGIAVLRSAAAWRRVAAAGALGLLALSVGLLRVSVLIYGVVLSPLPATATRGLVVLAICTGTAAMTAAAVASFSVAGPPLIEAGAELPNRF